MFSYFKERYRVSEERLVICRKCDKFNQLTSQCGECGCFMDYKTLLPNVSCPLGKWTTYEEKDK